MFLVKTVKCMANIALILFLCVVGGSAVFADRPLLTVTISETGEVREFDRAALKALPSKSYQTSSLWTEGIHEYTGFSFQTLVEALRTEEGIFVASAINNYSVEFPLEDVSADDGPIIAYEKDGKPMSIREKGPLWVIYPYDDNAKYRTETYYSRSIWQLDRIEIRN